MTELETKKDHDLLPHWENTLVRRPDGRGVEKIQRRHAETAELLLGSELRRIAEAAAKDTHPVVENIRGIDTIIADPENPRAYTYASLHPDFVDCYHVVVNEALGAKANVAKRAPYDMLQMTLPEGGDFFVSVQSEDGFMGDYAESDAVQTEILELFDTCRQAAKDVEPNAVTSRQPRGFGAAIARLTRR